MAPSLARSGLRSPAALLLAALLAVPVAGSEDTGPEPNWDHPLVDREGSFFGGAGRSAPLAPRYSPGPFPIIDRLYVGGETRVYAVQSASGASAWQFSGGRGYVDLSALGDGRLSAGPLAVNYGDVLAPEPEFLLYVGLNDGTVLGYRDTYDPSCIFNPHDPACRQPTPLPDLVWRTQVGTSAVTGLAVYNPEGAAGRTGRERLAVATQEGQVHLFVVNATSLNHSLLGVWQSSGVPLLAERPMRGLTGVPQWSPAFNQTGGRLALVTSDGVLHVVDSPLGQAPSTLWSLSISPKFYSWSAPVIVPTPIGGPHGGREIVLIGSSEGYLVARYLDGTLVAGWEGFAGAAGYPDGAVRLASPEGGPEKGSLTQPAVSGTSIFVASTTGTAYRVLLDPTGTRPSGAVEWAVSDRGLSCLEPRFHGPPVVFEAIGRVFFTADLKEAPDVSRWIHGAVYGLDDDSGRREIRIRPGQRIAAGPVIGQDPEHVFETLWFVATGTQTAVYGYDLRGTTSTSGPVDCPPDATPAVLAVAAVVGVPVAGAVLLWSLSRRKMKRSAKKTCSRCGAALVTGGAYCSACGAPVSK